MAKNATDVAQKWATNLSNATTSITNGVNAVSTAPGQLAAAQANKWITRLQASQAKWARNVSAVSLADWKNAMINKGIPRIATGAQAAQPKFQAFMTQFLTYLDAGKGSIDAMPTDTLAQASAKMVAQMNYNAQFQYNRA